ncbi:MAG: SH3 domain-containing protein [Christensenellales bacterium]|nr:SH3 domain-containing protein [Christensenellales bacterium]
MFFTSPRIRFPFFAALLALLLLSACAALGEGPLTPGTLAYVSNPDPTDRLNLRVKPAQDAASLGKYYSGVPVQVLDTPKNGWAHVRIDPYEGYMDADYLTASHREVVYALPRLIVSSPGGATLRSQPTESAKALYSFSQHSEIYNVQGVLSNGWIHVNISGTGGFLLGDQLTPRLSYHKQGSSPVGYTAYVCNPNPTDRLNLRSTASADAESLGKYYNGVEVLVLETLENGFWRVRILSTRQEGYMDAAYLSFEPVRDVRPSVTVRNPGGTGANLRAAPSTSAAYDYTIGNGEKLSVLGVRTDGWLHVQYEGLYGYVRGELVSPQIPYVKP